MASGTPQIIGKIGIIGSTAGIKIDEFDLGQKCRKPMTVAVVQFFGEHPVQTGMQLGGSSAAADAVKRHILRQRAIAMQPE
jgi:hypothetical protein